MVRLLGGAVRPRVQCRGGSLGESEPPRKKSAPSLLAREHWGQASPCRRARGARGRGAAQQVLGDHTSQVGVHKQIPSSTRKRSPRHWLRPMRDTREAWLPPPGGEDLLQEEMEGGSSVLAWRTRGQRGLAGCGLRGRKESDTTEVTQRAHTADPHTDGEKHRSVAQTSPCKDQVVSGTM